MSHMNRWLPLCLLASLTACMDGSDPLNVAPDASMTMHASDRASSCFTPAFTVALTPTGAGAFEGELTGDLEGSVTVEFDLPGSLRFHGVTIKNSGAAHWTITGGVIPDLEAFDTTFENMNLDVDRPGSGPGIFENVGRHRATDGVERANLTYNGLFDASIPAGAHHYRGVICT